MPSKSVIDIFLSIGAWCSGKHWGLVTAVCAIVLAMALNFAIGMHFDFQALCFLSLFTLSGLFAFGKAERLRIRFLDINGARGPIFWLRKSNLFLHYGFGIFTSIGGGIGILLQLLDILKNW
jgi:hypothetical protein